ARERDEAQRVAERLQRVAPVERDVDRAAAALGEAEHVVEPLAPLPAPLGDAALGEDVLADVVVHAVADEARVRTLYAAAAAVLVGRRRHAEVRRVRLAPRRVRLVVPAAVQALDLE